MEKMTADMKKGMDPDATKAWAKMMVSHHKGAIEISQIVLETKDLVIREMAEKGSRSRLLPFDYLLISWFVLAAGSTAYVAFDQFNGNPEQFTSPLWRQGIGSTIHCVAGDAEA